MVSLKTKTLLCVAVAGSSFIPAVLFDLKYLLIIGAFFDWLPLMTQWMKFGEGELSRIGLTAHILLTLTAYTFLVVWIFTSSIFTSFSFLEIWWLAVVSGNFIYEKGK